ncbi:MAG: CPBP family intramembrane glutamic endopeptidase [Promethearchaeota archaeon]
MHGLEEYYGSFIRFILITFTFSWLLWLPSLLSSFNLIQFQPWFNLFMILGSFGPFVAGFSLAYVDRGIKGVKVLWTRGWHCEKKIYILISLALIPLLCGFSLLLSSIFSGVNLSEYQIQYPYGLIFAEVLGMFFFGGPFQEEFGWRGYALNNLQSKLNAFESSLILGGTWSIWHYPLFFIPGTTYTYQSFFSFTITILALSIIFTWLHNSTNGSVLVAMLFHSSVNTTYVLYIQRISAIGGVYFIILLDIVMITILIVFGQEKLKWTKKNEKLSMKISS